MPPLGLMQSMYVVGVTLLHVIILTKVCSPHCSPSQMTWPCRSRKTAWYLALLDCVAGFWQWVSSREIVSCRFLTGHWSLFTHRRINRLRLYFLWFTMRMAWDFQPWRLMCDAFRQCDAFRALQS